MTDDGEQPTRAIRALWGEEEQGRRGPKPTLTVREIAEAAVEIADRDGLEAASMAAVAKQLERTAMSLYRYVDSRTDLHAVMMDVAIGPAPELNRRRGWRGQLEEWARLNVVRVHAHAWLLDVRNVGPPVTPNFLGWMDRGMAPLIADGMDPQAAASALLIVDGFVNHHVELARRYADAEQNRTWGERLSGWLDSEHFPTLTEVMASGTFDDDEDGDFPGDEFEFGLRVVLDGIAQLPRVVGRARR